MKKIFTVLLVIAMLSFFASCNNQKENIGNPPSSENGEQTMLTLEDLISDIPQNTAYRQTILQSYPSGEESRWDIFFDDHDNEIRNICTSQIINHPNPSLAASKEFPFLTDTTYIYNEDGTIAEQNYYFAGSVRTSRFEYNADKTIARKFPSENGNPWATLSYEYDDLGNPVKVHSILDGEIIFTDEYEYTYDENGRITYKIFKSRLYDEQIYEYWYEYDEHGNKTYEKEFIEGADFPSYNKYYYDENDRLIREESYMNEKLLAETIYEYEFYS